MFVAAVVAAVLGGRKGLRERIRKEWGQPIERVRKMDAMAASHRSRLAEAVTPSAALDDRTCDDLHLNAVFAALDRTESALGQHALYHRLRTTAAGGRLHAERSPLRLSSIERCRVPLPWIASVASP